MLDTSANAVGQGREVAHITAVALANPDVGDLEFFEREMVCDHNVRLQSGSPRCIALVAVFFAPTIKRSNHPGRTFAGKWL
jgi:hypothetical protein